MNIREITNRSSGDKSTHICTNFLHNIRHNQSKTHGLNCNGCGSFRSAPEAALLGNCEAVWLRNQTAGIATAQICRPPDHRVPHVGRHIITTMQPSLLSRYLCLVLLPSAGVYLCATTLAPACKGSRARLSGWDYIMLAGTMLSDLIGQHIPAG